MYLDADCTLQAILPTERKKEFIDLFLPEDIYEHANISTYRGKVFMNGYAYQIDEEDNPHGLTAVKIAFMAEEGIHDFMISQNNAFVIRDVCQDLQIKRLMAYGKNDNEGVEETLQYNNQGKYIYEIRDLYPEPFIDCYLSDDEKLNDYEECM